jgi:excinuclease UvrABC ATPase subunit
MDYSIFDMTDMQVDELIHVLRQFDEPAAEPIVQTLIERLQILIDIGLGYLTLTRETSSLSSGESQRVKLVRHLSSNLTDMLYIFDEPSIGLHPRDVHRMNKLLMTLRDKGNTLLVVEHDPDVIKIADYVIDMGPYAGMHGGEIVYAGSYNGLLSAPTLTGECLQMHIAIKENPRAGIEYYESEKSSLHNLKNISLRVPKHVFTVITGVAGSGKSTLVNKVFAKTYPEVITVDQSPVHANSRSNPATYSGVMDAIRTLFSEANDVNAGFFSYNSKGACEACKGAGTIELNLSFMDMMIMPCEECDGKRFKKDVLQYQYKEKNILSVMNMTIEEAFSFFDTPQIKKKLQNLIDVGLGYMTLGQPLSTLSGGECQRMKLARELNKKGNIYILDEPTTGLHRSDIQHILSIIDKLVDKGNTVIAIEHNLDVMKHADWIVDMGPDSGSHGGEILFEGLPIDLMACKKSITAEFLRDSPRLDPAGRPH